MLVETVDDRSSRENPLAPELGDGLAPAGDGATELEDQVGEGEFFVPVFVEELAHTDDHAVTVVADTRGLVHSGSPPWWGASSSATESSVRATGSQIRRAKLPLSHGSGSWDEQGILKMQPP